MRKLLISGMVLLCVGVITSLFAQRTITGFVIDHNGTPLIGANVVEMETWRHGTVADISGVYEITVADTVLLQFSYSGYETQEHIFGPSNTLKLAKEAFQEAMQGGVLTSNAENILYPFLSDADNENSYFTRFRNVSLEAINSTLLNKLVELRNPRLYAYADPAQSDSTYAGMPYSVDDPSSDPAALSLPHSKNVRGQDLLIPHIFFCKGL